MKIKKGYMLRNIVGDWVVMPVGERVADFNGMMTLSEGGMLLWRKLENDCQKEDLINELLSHYDVSYQMAAQDVEEFIQSLVDGGVLDKEGESQ